MRLSSSEEQKDFKVGFGAIGYTEKVKLQEKLRSGQRSMILIANGTESCTSAFIVHRMSRYSRELITWSTLCIVPDLP